VTEPQAQQTWVKVFAPASIANLGPGFDSLGVALEDRHDRSIVLYAECRDAAPVMADIALALRRCDPTWRSTQGGHFPERACVAFLGGPGEIDERARVRRPTWMLMIRVVAGDLKRSPAGQQSHPHLPSPIGRSDERYGLPVRRGCRVLLHAHEIGDALQVDDGRRLPSDDAVPDHHRDGGRSHLICDELDRRDESRISAGTRRVELVHTIGGETQVEEGAQGREHQDGAKSQKPEPNYGLEAEREHQPDLSGGD